MKTVQETFRDAIEQGDWSDIRRVYTAIVGEDAPHPPLEAREVPLSDVLSQTLPTMRKGDPLKRPMPDPDASMTKEDYDRIFPDEDEEDDIMVDMDDRVDHGIRTSPREVEDEIPDTLPANDPDPEPEPEPDPMDEFRIEHGPQGPSENEDGETACRKESMSIPSKRKNRFRDNGRAFADEKVTNDPKNPALGIQSIRPRMANRDKDIGANTGEKIEVICGFCKKKEVVAARLALGFNKNPEHNTYRCNSCSTPNGRAKEMRKQRNANNGVARRKRG